MSTLNGRSSGSMVKRATALLREKTKKKTCLFMQAQ